MISMHDDIITYINGALFTRLDIFLSVISSNFPFYKNAKQIAHKYQAFRINISDCRNRRQEVTVVIEPYKGDNIHVLMLRDYLEKYVKNKLVGAYVHGSLGTYEEISYSDFDALVILKDDVFDNPRSLCKVASKLNKARSFMYSLDPVQHHGWFVLSESCLKHYPLFYFPIELFTFAKSVFKDKGLKLNLETETKIMGFQKNFVNLSRNIEDRLKGRRYPKNAYQAKVLLSQLMLLPALYVQAKYGKGIYKKFSFEKAKVDFSEEEWSIMEDISKIRESWELSISPLNRWLLTRSNQGVRKLIISFIPSISGKTKNIMNGEFYRRMLHLIDRMKKNVSYCTY